MFQEETNNPDRRAFPPGRCSRYGGGPGRNLQAWRRRTPPAKPPILPKRKLGKTGVEITLLEMGTGALREQGVLDRLLRLAFASGVRTFDTAKLYGTEPGFKKWFEQSPEVRKQIVLVTKDEVATPQQMLKTIDQRLAALGTDYVDFYFIHGLGDNHTLDEAMNFVKSQEFKETAEAIRKSGKAKFFGFSTHHKDRAQIIQAAAEGGIVDAIMLMYTPWLDKDSAAQQGARRLPREGDRSDLDEAGRR